MWTILVFINVFPYMVLTEVFKKIEFTRGVVCNFESFYTWQGSYIHRFFCVPGPQCRQGVRRFPLVPYDSCDTYMSAPTYIYSTERMVCCHQQDITQHWAEHWDRITYLPGVRTHISMRLLLDNGIPSAFGTGELGLMPGGGTIVLSVPNILYTVGSHPLLIIHTVCKEQTKTICGPNDVNYCNDPSITGAADSTVFAGLPTLINKYPHTALIGYHNVEKSKIGGWHWFCLGTILTKRYVLTVWKCIQDGPHSATNIKVGESRLCPLDHCPDRDEEQILEILEKNRQDSVNTSDPNDVALFQTKTAIQFNKFVRPACLFADLTTRESQGWFARYGKPEILAKSKPGRRPLFIYSGEVVTAFKVKTDGEARLVFSRSGLPFKNEVSYEIKLGINGNQDSSMIRINKPMSPVLRFTPDLLSSRLFWGFWVRLTHHEISVGREDSSYSLLDFNDPDGEMNLTTVGFYTPNFTGEWIFSDYKALSSLHEFELETSYEKDCKPAQGEDDGSFFCAKNVKEKFTPCEDDWGGGLMLQSNDLYCMWSIFAVFTREKPEDCSDYHTPAIFKAVNRPGILGWVEEILYPDFNIVNVNLDEPVCTNPDLNTEGRCFKPNGI